MPAGIAAGGIPSPKAVKDGFRLLGRNLAAGIGQPYNDAALLVPAFDADQTAVVDVGGRIIKQVLEI